MKRQKALVTPSVIKWARKKAHYDIAAAAKKLKVKPEQLKKWESGKEKPTLSQARNMAKLYRRPFAAFYLPNPPKDFPLLKDFRTIEGSKPVYSPTLVFFIRQIQERQMWLSQFLKQRGYENLKFIGSANMQFSPKSIAKKIIKTIWNTEAQYLDSCSKITNPDKVLRKWLNQCEAKGIFISRTSNINTSNKIKGVRGFVISDKYAPFIFIHSKDSQPAQLFTLLHELAHLWIDSSGIPDNYPISSKTREELFCNRVAAEILMPEDKMKELPKIKSHTIGNIKTFVEEYFKQFKVVSKLAFLVRLKDLSLLKNNTSFNELNDEYKQEFQFKQSQDVKGAEQIEFVNPHLLKVNANSKSFTRIVISSYKEGVISGRDTSNLLDVKLKRIKDLERFIG